MRHLLALDEFPNHVVRSVGKGREVMQRRDVGMLNFRRELRLAKEAFVRVGIFGDLRFDDLDDAGGAQKSVLDFIDLSHPTRPQALDDPVLSIDRFVRIAVEEIRYRLATMRTGFEGALDLGVTPDTAKSHSGTNDTTCW